jgi:HD-GYP domain-containing protein (c-di-GMP phosphodiesterase class II)
MSRPLPPRFVARTTIATLVMVALVLTAVFVSVAINVRERVRSSVTDKLDAGQRMLFALEQRRAREMAVQVAMLAENPTLKAALDTYQSERDPAGAAFRREMLATIERELDKLADRIDPDVVAVTDQAGRVLAAAGRRAVEWPLNNVVRPTVDDEGNAYVAMTSGVFQFASAPVALQENWIGTLQIAKALDARYAQELSSLSGAATLVISNQSVSAATIDPAIAEAITKQLRLGPPAGPTLTANRVEYAVKLLCQRGDAAVYAVDSIGASTRVPMQQALRAVLFIAVGSFICAAIGSVWIARTVSRPIHKLSAALSEMTSSRNFDHPMPLTGVTRELDQLTDAFNSMMRSVVRAEAETESAYVGAIRALALALDARDPYTAGHSERVSALSVAVGRQMRLPDGQLEVLRLGALLHDIGKIGISDAVLRKPGPLTQEEFEMIQEHPAVGGRILRSVPFLAPHLPIVELHHERPDGQGYPFRLRADEIPILARIVHVADAFDAITSARAYRPARGSADALRELWKHAGTQFDAEVVHALAAALPSIELTAHGRLADDAGQVASRLALVGGGERP